MKFLVLADIHGHVEHLPDIEAVVDDCAGIVLAGDITDFGGAEQARFILSSFSAYGKPLVAVPGNCDLPGVEDELRKDNISLHGNLIKLNGVQFIGVGGSLPCPGAAPNEVGESDFRRFLEKGASGHKPGDNIVLVTHQPARGIRLDRGVSRRHTGSEAIREFIERYQPILAISGHIHEACGVDKLGTTTLLNPGPFRQGRYAVVEIDEREVRIQLYP